MSRFRRIFREHIVSTRSAGMVFAFVFLAVGGVAAQYGHPIRGSWSGDWGPNKETRNRLLLELNWDGKSVSGTINPGPNAVTLQKASVDPSNWTVHFEAEGKDQAGRAVRYVVDGKIENLGSYNRVLSGTWTQGAVKGDFRVVRN
jgi:hypothetical protein